MVSKERKNELQKQYYRRHKEYYREYNKKYWEKNREQILALYREMTVARWGKNYHKPTQSSMI